MPVALELEGEVVEQQSFLNGTRYLLIEAEGEGWNAQLSLTLPREEGASLREADLALSADGRAWQGVAASGEHHTTWDDAIDAQILDVQVRFEPVPDAESSEPWRLVEGRLRIAGDTVSLVLSLSES